MSPCLLLARALFLPNHFLQQHSCCNCGMEESLQGPSGQGPGRWHWLVPVPVWMTGKYLQVFTSQSAPRPPGFTTGAPWCCQGSAATATRVSANHSRAWCGPSSPGCWTFLCSQLLSAHGVKRERPGWSFSAPEHPQATGQGSGFLCFDRKAAQMKPLSAPSGGFTLPQVLIFSRCFT